MDALQGYGSSSDSEADKPGGAGDASPVQPQGGARGAPPQTSGNAGNPATSGIVLPSAADLFAAPGQPSR
jgi:hypothetical protein